MRSNMMILAFGVLCALAMASACTDSEDDDGVPGLDSAHPGWGNPGCFGNGCHDEGSTHHSDLRSFECVECHGNNGAPDGHGGSTPCSSCHGEPHGQGGYPDPQSCETCHD